MNEKTNNKELASSFLTFLDKLQELDVNPSVMEYIALMSQAKYSTFMSEDKENLFFSLDVPKTMLQIISYEKSKSSSRLIFPIIFKYGKNLKSIPQDDYI